MAIDPAITAALSEMGADDGAVLAVQNLQRNFDLVQGNNSDLTSKLADMTAQRDELKQELNDTKNAILQQASQFTANQTQVSATVSSSTDQSQQLQVSSGGTVNNSGTIFQQTDPTVSSGGSTSSSMSASQS